jgi:hypothetical protein
MTRPDWCPQDVWEKAVCYLVVDVQDHKAIARAILAERERCAQRVLAYAGDAGEQNDPPEIRHLAAIVRAIRAGTPCP